MKPNPSYETFHCEVQHAQVPDSEHTNCSVPFCVRSEEQTRPPVATVRQQRSQQALLTADLGHMTSRRIYITVTVAFLISPFDSFFTPLNTASESTRSTMGLTSSCSLINPFHSQPIRCLPADSREATYTWVYKDFTATTIHPTHQVVAPHVNRATQRSVHPQYLTVTALEFQTQHVQPELLHLGLVQPQLLLCKNIGRCTCTPVDILLMDIIQCNLQRHRMPIW